MLMYALGRLFNKSSAKWSRDAFRLQRSETTSNDDLKYFVYAADSTGSVTGTTFTSISLYGSRHSGLRPVECALTFTSFSQFCFN